MIISQIVPFHEHLYQVEQASQVIMSACSNLNNFIHCKIYEKLQHINSFACAGLASSLVCNSLTFDNPNPIYLERAVDSKKGDFPFQEELFEVVMTICSPLLQLHKLWSNVRLLYHAQPACQAFTLQFSRLFIHSLLLFPLNCINFVQMSTNNADLLGSRKLSSLATAEERCERRTVRSFVVAVSSVFQAAMQCSGAFSAARQQQ